MRFVPQSLAALVCLSLAATLTGCSGFQGATFPDASANAAASDVSSISGSVYGGHAPLVGAHIYLVQPGVTGYGSVVTNLLTSSANASYPLVQNGNWPSATSGGNTSDQFVPATDASGNPFYGVTANLNGEFQLSGDYTCVAGRPVILIGYGGYPSFVPTTTGGTNTFTVTNATEVNNGSTGFTFTYTVATTATTPELFYPGETVTVTGAPNGSYGFNNTGTVIGDSTLTTTTFSIYVAYGSNPNLGNGTPSNLVSGNIGQSVTATPAFNPAAVNMAVLGNCPSNGTFATGPSAIRYVYMNEISTTAAAYAFSPFANWAQNDQNGNDEFHIGAPGTAQTLQALANAANTAGLLYDIQGGNTAANNPDGDVHIARTTTPNGGSGTVPQTTIDAIGNILAACVDSNNTYRLGTGTKSTQCQMLGFYAADNGVYDTTGSTTHQAFNIAQAAMNLARYPQGAGTSTSTNCNGFNYCTTQTVTAGTLGSAKSMTTALYNLPTGNVPFTPQLSAVPNDWSIAIQWSPGSAMNEVQIDAAGNAFAVAGASGMYEVTPSGTVSTYTAATGLSTALSAGLSIDNTATLGGNVWAAGSTGVYKFVPGTAAGTLLGGGNSALAGSVALDTALNQYIASGNDGIGIPALAKQNSTGTSAGGNFPIYGSGAAAGYSAGICENAVGFDTLDSSNNIWTATSENAFNGIPYVCRFDSNGNLKYALAVQTGASGQAGGFGFPRGLATDASDNAFFTDKNLDALYRITAGTTTNGQGYSQQVLHAQLSAPKGVAVDGANTVWVANTGDLNATTGAKYGTGLVQFSATSTLLTPNYITGAAYTTSPTTSLGSVAIDPSGNVWATQSVAQGSLATATALFEYVGMATPTVTPIVAAKAAKTTGGKPGLTVAHVYTYAISANVIYLVAADEAFTVGETVSLSGFGTSTFLNGQQVTITSTPGSGFFLANFTHANVSQVNEVGVASAIN